MGMAMLPRVAERNKDEDVGREWNGKRMSIQMPMVVVAVDAAVAVAVLVVAVVSVTFV